MSPIRLKLPHRLCLPVFCTFFYTVFCPVACFSFASAAEGDPLAIRLWADDVVTLETNGGLTLGICVNDAGKNETDVDQWVSCQTERNHVLARTPNDAAVTFEPIHRSSQDTENAITIHSKPTQDSHLIVAGVDGVRIAFGSAACVASLKEGQVVGALDALVVIGDLSNPTPAFQQSIEQLSPRFLIVRQSDGAADLRPTAEKRSHNTFALASKDKNDEAVKVIAMETTPWQPPADLAKLFAAMTDANQKSQAVFAKLSVDQMNFRPSNGTHTPRWNTEHMMGRQLKFFSQIYHAIDPTIPVMDLNPAQMPPDYKASHPDWDGAEEARQMQRVNDFCERFAYLLDGLDVEAKAPGSRWPSLRALLVQMERHYGEHTSNTVKKFELEDWPEQ